jgi:serine/threonine protein kinase
MTALCASCNATNEDVAEVCFSCGAVLGAITRGTVIAGRYEVTKRLGQGGMGVVYAAHDRVLDETIAIKLLHSSVVDDSLARRFRSEIKLARRITHPNVCRIHDYGEEGTRRYISMELVEGRDLKQELRARGRLPPDEAYSTAIQVAEGLHAIHAAKVVHRDLKTPNLMRDAAGVVRVMDFGIAKQFGVDSPSAGNTGTGQIVGTPEYMSPEQVRGEPLDARSDVYALGIVIWELFTGQVPFRGDTPVATLFKHLSAPVPFDLNTATLPPALVPVLARALAKSADDRYPSAGELAEALRVASRDTAQATIVTSPPTILTQPAAPPRPGPPPLPHTAVAKKGAPWVTIAVVGGLSSLALLLQITKSAKVAPPASAAPAAAVTLATEPTSITTPSVPVKRIEPRITLPPPTVRPVRMAETSSRPAPPAARAAVLAPPVTTPAASAAPTAAQAPGELQIGVKPYAEVFVDGASVGTTPMRPLQLPAGRHTVRLEHPDFQPLQRVVTVLENQRARLVIDLAQDALRR